MLLLYALTVCGPVLVVIHLQYVLVAQLHNMCYSMAHVQLLAFRFISKTATINASLVYILAINALQQQVAFHAKLTYT